VDVFHQRHRRAALEGDLDAGGRRAEAVRGPWRGGEAVAEIAESQAAGGPGAGSARRALGGVGLAEHARASSSMAAPAGVSATGRVATVQQGQAELGVQLADLLAHRWLRDVHALSRSAEVALFGDGHEVATSGRPGSLMSTRRP
jgi:hypothetical protein